MIFMSPELLVPSKFGMKNSIPTPEADIYAFGLVVFQVREPRRNYRLFSYFVQVLTGEIPFRGVRRTELGYSITRGERPNKPASASAIGFSDSLWSFVQRCWAGDMNMRPKVTEVVTHLKEAAANWDGLMPPCIQTENIASYSDEPVSDSMLHCEFKISTPPFSFTLSNGTGGIFQSSSGVSLESPTDSQAISGLFSYPSTLPTQYTELSQDVTPEVATTPPKEPQLESPSVSTQQWTVDPYDTSHAEEIFPHLNQHFNPPPSELPRKKRRSFITWLLHWLRKSWGLPSGPPSQAESAEVPMIPPRDYTSGMSSSRELGNMSGQY